MMDWLIWISTSDFCGTGPSDLKWLAIQTGHIAIGMFLGWLAQYSRPATAFIFCAWLSKEFAGDIAGCEAQAEVVLDSATDLWFGALGFALNGWRRARLTASLSRL